MSKIKQLFNKLGGDPNNYKIYIMDLDKIYVGSAKQLDKGGLSMELNLTQLMRFLKSEDSKEFVKEFKTKDGNQESIKLVAWPLKEPRDYQTHYIKVNTYKPESKKEDLPF